MTTWWYKGELIDRDGVVATYRFFPDHVMAPTVSGLFRIDLESFKAEIVEPAHAEALKDWFPPMSAAFPRLHTRFAKPFRRRRTSQSCTSSLRWLLVNLATARETMETAHMGQVPLEVLELEPMASGDQSLRLTILVGWEEFASYAPAVIRLLGGSIVERSDSAPQRVWTAVIDGQRFWISFDAHALGVSLDPQDRAAAALVPSIRERLINWRAR